MEYKNYVSELDILDKIGYGAYGTVYSCIFNNKQYAYKNFIVDNSCKEFIKPRLDGVSKFYGDSDFIFPYKFIYDNNDYFIGYVMDYLSGYNSLYDIKLDYKGKIEILNRARYILDKFHNEYKHVHTDINPWNFLYNKELDKIILIDFDTCIDLNNPNTMDISQLNTLAKIYCDYNGTNIGLDVFLFNLLTFSILNNIEFYDVINEIMNNNYGVIENKNAIEILSKYEDIEYNTLKKEYIIDYL